MSTDTIVTIIAVLFFGGIALFIVVGILRACWLDKHPERDSERIKMHDRIMRNAADQGITQDDLSQMTPDQLLELSWTDRDRFLMAHGIYSGWTLWNSFLPVRPGHRAFSESGLRIKEAIIYLSFVIAYVLGEWTDDILYQRLPYMDVMQGGFGSYSYLNLYRYECVRDSISGYAGILAVLLLCLGMVLLEEKRRRWQKFSFLLVPVWLIGGDLFWYWTSFIPSRGSDYYDGHAYNVFKVGWAGMDISQYAWLAFTVMTILAVMILPLIRAHQRKKSSSGFSPFSVREFDETRPDGLGHNLGLACLFFLPVSLVYLFAGGEHPAIMIIICAVAALADVYVMDNFSALSDWAHREKLDSVYEWNAAFWIVFAAFASVAVVFEGISGLSNARKGTKE